MPGMPLALSSDAMKHALQEISKIAKDLYVEIAEDNPWK